MKQATWTVLFGFGAMIACGGKVQGNQEKASPSPDSCEAPTCGTDRQVDETECHMFAGMCRKVYACGVSIYCAPPGGCLTEVACDPGDSYVDSASCGKNGECYVASDGCTNVYCERDGVFPSNAVSVEVRWQPSSYGVCTAQFELYEYFLAKHELAVFRCIEEKNAFQLTTTLPVNQSDDAAFRSVLGTFKRTTEPTCKSKTDFVVAQVFTNGSSKREIDSGSACDGDSRVGEVYVEGIADLLTEFRRVAKATK